MENSTVDIIELKKIMVENKLDKITNLANATGIGRTTLSNLLNGKAKPSFNVLKRLIKGLGISPSKAGEIFFSSNLYDIQDN